jgi:hypothetical protein
VLTRAVERRRLDNGAVDPLHLGDVGRVGADAGVLGPALEGLAARGAPEHDAPRGRLQRHELFTHRTVLRHLRN